MSWEVQYPQYNMCFSFLHSKQLLKLSYAITVDTSREKIIQISDFFKQMGTKKNQVWGHFCQLVGLKWLRFRTLDFEGPRLQK